MLFRPIYSNFKYDFYLGEEYAYFTSVGDNNITVKAYNSELIGSLDFLCFFGWCYQDKITVLECESVLIKQTKDIYCFIHSTCVLNFFRFKEDIIQAFYTKSKNTDEEENIFFCLTENHILVLNPDYTKSYYFRRKDAGESSGEAEKEMVSFLDLIYMYRIPEMPCKEYIFYEEKPKLKIKKKDIDYIEFDY